eukprot:scaffold53716_cov66-Attheya_sp.AAC.1
MEVSPWWVFGLPVIALVNYGVGCPKTTENCRGGGWGLRCLCNVRYQGRRGALYSYRLSICLSLKGSAAFLTLKAPCRYDRGLKVTRRALSKTTTAGNG